MRDALAPAKEEAVQKEKVGRKREAPVLARSPRRCHQQQKSLLRMLVLLHAAPGALASSRRRAWATRASASPDSGSNAPAAPAAPAAKPAGIARRGVVQKTGSKDFGFIQSDEELFFFHQSRHVVSGGMLKVRSSRVAVQSLLCGAEDGSRLRYVPP